jgi:hypothetical protein
MSEGCPAGCCPHDGVAPDARCPADLPLAPLPERAAHLYACQMLSTYKIGAVTGIDRQKITPLLHQAGVAVKPNGAGRRMTRRTQKPSTWTSSWHACTWSSAPRTTRACLLFSSEPVRTV